MGLDILKGLRLPSQRRAKRTSIAKQIRGQIVAGSIKPGEQLPSRSDIQRHLGSSMTTLQQAFEELKHDGFIVCRGRGGTYVSDNPPHRCRFGVLTLGSYDLFNNYSGLWGALRMSARHVERERNIEIAFYEGLEWHSDNAAYQRLCKDVQTCCLAGMFMPFTVNWHEHHDVLHSKYVLKTCISRNASLPDMVGLPYDGISMVTRAVDYFHRHGCRRMAMVNNGSLRSATESALMDALAARGMVTKPYWVLKQTAETVQNTVQVLMSLPPDERPDSLLVADEALAIGTGLALKDSPVRVPDELRVLCHTSFPRLWAPAVPMTWFGWSGREYLNTFIDVVQRFHDTGELISERPMPVRFEEELDDSERAVPTVPQQESAPSQIPEGAAVQGGGDMPECEASFGL